MSRTIRRFDLAEQLRSSHAATLSRSMDAREAHALVGTTRGRGFPRVIRYFGRRSALTGRQDRLTFEATYGPEKGSFREDETTEQVTYVYWMVSAFRVHVVRDKSGGRWDFFKCLGDRFISHASGRNYAEAMILATGVGLRPEEPATTLEGTMEEFRQEHEAQWEMAREQQRAFSSTPERKPAHPPVEEIYPRPGKLVFGVIDRGCKVLNLVFMPRKEAERLRAVHEALESRTWGEFRRRMPRDDHEEVLEKFAEDYRWRNFDEFCADEGSARDREDLWAEYASLPISDRPPLDDDRFECADIPGLCDGDWPDWAEQLMLRWLPGDVIEAYGEVKQSVLNGPFLIFDPAHAPEIIAALEAQGYQCAWHEELVARACGYSTPVEEGEE